MQNSHIPFMNRSKEKLNIVIVEDNEKLNNALKKGLENTKEIRVIQQFSTSEDTIKFCKKEKPDLVLMDVALRSAKNGIECTIELRNFYPRLPVVIYSIQDEDRYYRDFRNSGILSHYAYVKKSNFLLPEMILPLIKDAFAGKSFIDPEIENRVKEVQEKDVLSPLSLLEPREKDVALMIAKGYSNDQIAQMIGLKDKRSISRINGMIYTVWDLRDEKMDESVARTRVSIIVRENKLLTWEKDGKAFYKDISGNWIKWNPF